jgi:polynucleotide 5'-kinase involved in rRNA processing
MATDANNGLNGSDSSKAQLSQPSKVASLKVKQGRTVLLRGPLELHLEDGDAEIFGAKIKSNDSIEIEVAKQAPLLIREECSIQIRPGPGGSWKEIEEPTIPTSWIEAVEIVQRQRGTVIVLGDVDSGKSSICTYLTNMCVQDGLKVGVVDADVGQADIGPPTTVSSASASRPIFSLQELRQETAFFAGDTSPSSVPNKIILQVTELMRDLAGSSDVVIVNTDGWVQDPAALRFKETLVNEVHPDLVLGLNRAGELDPLLNIVPFASLRLASSQYALTRSKEQRKDTREAGYRRFLLNSKTVRIQQEDTQLRTYDKPQQSILEWDRRAKGIVAGLLDEGQRLLGIGRIREVSDGNALVETRVGERATFLELGNIVLSPDYEETGYAILH